MKKNTNTNPYSTGATIIKATNQPETTVKSSKIVSNTDLRAKAGK